jgi:hypothetical protein
MRREAKFTETERASILAVAAMLTAFAWFATDLDPVSRALTAVLSGVAAVVASAVTVRAIHDR